MENNLITFPRNEWDNIKSRLNNAKTVYTIRAGNEYEKYKIGDVKVTEWGSKIKIISIKKIKGGINELKKEYEFFSEIGKDSIQELMPYREMEIISLDTTLEKQNG